MTQNTFDNQIASCERFVPLIEQKLVNEPLTDDETRLVQHHLAHCKTCSEFVAVMNRLSEFAPDESPEMLERTVQAAVIRFFQQQPIVQRKWRAVILVAAAAAISVAGILWSIWATERSYSHDAPDCVITQPNEVVPGVWLSYCDNLPPQTESDAAGNLNVRMENGAIGISADPNRAVKGGITVHTTHGRVQVLGTVFTVHKDKEDSHVDVFRGKVVVFPDGNGSPRFSVSEGHGAWFSTQQRFVLSGGAQNNWRNVLSAVTYIQPQSTVSEQSLQGGKIVEPDTDTEEAALSQTVAVHRRLGRSSGIPATSLDDLLHQARSCLLEKEWECAAANYRSIIQNYDKSWESMSAYISLAKIELRNLGRPSSAKKYFSAYQKRNPNGPLVEDALFGMAECERQLGHPEKELKILRSFIARHSDSPLAVKANKRISELEAVIR